MSDPAMEAGRRALESDEYRTVPIVVAAAREALKPIRALHKPWNNCGHACCSHEQCRLLAPICDHEGAPWPCETAKLIFTSEELQQ